MRSAAPELPPSPSGAVPHRVPRGQRVGRDEDKAKAQEAEETEADHQASAETGSRSCSQDALAASAHATEEEDGGMQGHATTYMPRRAHPVEIARQVCADTRFWKFFGLVVILLGVRLVFRHLDATFPKYMVREFGPDVMFGTIIGCVPPPPLPRRGARSPGGGACAHLSPPLPSINPFLIIIFVPLFSPFLSHVRAPSLPAACPALPTSGGWPAPHARIRPRSTRTRP